MGISNEEIEKATISPELKRQLKFAKQCPVIFNNANLMPSEASWIVPKDVLEQTITSLAGTYLGASEVVYSTIETRVEKGRAPTPAIWIRKNSKHLVDKTTTTDPNMLIQPTEQRFSQQLIDLCDQFGPTHRADGSSINRKKRVVIGNARDGDNGLVPIMLDFTRIIQRLFDAQSKGFLEVFGDDKTTARPCAITCKKIFEKSVDGVTSGNLTAIQVTKSYADSSIGKRKPVAVFSDRRK